MNIARMRPPYHGGDGAGAARLAAVAGAITGVVVFFFRRRETGTSRSSSRTRFPARVTMVSSLGEKGCGSMLSGPATRDFAAVTASPDGTGPRSRFRVLVPVVALLARPLFGGAGGPPRRP